VGRPTVSVIIPAFNVASYLTQAAHSALHQTHQDLELVIVDDGSTDETPHVADSLRAASPARVHVIHQANQGLSQARNAALEAARGEFVALLDGDDLWMPTFIERQLSVLRAHPEADIVTGNARFLGGACNGRPARPHPDPRPVPSLPTILADEESVFIMSVFRRTVCDSIGLFNRTLRTNEDYEFWLRAALAGHRFVRNSEPLGWYRVRADSLSADRVRMLDGILEVYRTFRPAIQDRPVELGILERQVLRFEAERYSAAATAGLARHRVKPPRSFVGAWLAGELPPRIAFSGTLARSAPRIFRGLRKLRRSADATSAHSNMAHHESASSDVRDRAGRSYWEGVWDHVDFAPPIDPRATSIWAHRDQLFHRFFRAHLGGVEPGFTLLELGCARSAWLPYFAREFKLEVSGLDYAAEGAAQTARHLKRTGVSADVRCADLFDPPTDWRGAFDAVTWFGVAEHFDDTACAVRAAAEYLKPGGLLVTEVPNMTGLIGRLQRFMNRPVFDIHVPLNRPQLCRAHAAAGLEVVSAAYLVPLDFGVVNLEGVPPGLRYLIKDWSLYLLRLMSGVIWWFDRRLGPVRPGRLTSGFVIVIARKPAPAAGTVHTLMASA
jgi:glycosyltransferase involved in cell wall biosynthesis/cyclopropane fatty-acyl-phospholipid synthase-like methyltransferase